MDTRKKKKPTENVRRALLNSVYSVIIDSGLYEEAQKAYLDAIDFFEERVDDQEGAEVIKILTAIDRESFIAGAATILDLFFGGVPEQLKDICSVK